MIAHCIWKDLLVFNTSPTAAYPVYIIESSRLADGVNDSEFPVCLAYNQYHYEALFPTTEEDINKTIYLKRRISEGLYSKDDIGILDLGESIFTKPEKEDQSADNLSVDEQLSNSMMIGKKAKMLYPHIYNLNKYQNEKARQRMKKVRKNYTLETKSKMREDRSKRFAKMTIEKKKEENSRCRVRVAKTRASQTEEKKNIENEKQRKIIMTTRMKQTVEQANKEKRMTRITKLETVPQFSIKKV